MIVARRAPGLFRVEATLAASMSLLFLLLYYTVILLFNVPRVSTIPASYPARLKQRGGQAGRLLCSLSFVGGGGGGGGDLVESIDGSRLAW